MPDTSSRCRVSRTHHGRFPLILSARALARAVPTEGTGIKKKPATWQRRRRAERMEQEVRMPIDILPGGGTP